MPSQFLNPAKQTLYDREQYGQGKQVLDKYIDFFWALVEQAAHSNVFNIDRMPNKAGAISSVVDLILCYQNHAEHTVFAITSLGKQDIILGSTWLWKHNRKVDWAQGKAYCASHLPFADLDLLDPLPLVFLYREALYKDNWSSSGAPEEELEEKFGGIYDLELLDKAVECKFEQTCDVYLRLIILHGAAESDLVKVAGVAEWLEPKNKKEVQAFLGFANFYQRFIQNFLHHAHPLFDLTTKDTTWSWEPLEQMAFDALKHAITSRPVLLFPDNNSLFWVEANSFDFTTRAVLLQQSREDGKWHPVAFYSKNLSMLECNYEIHNKEMLAIVWPFKEWQHFLEGAWHNFKVWMDYKNLKYFQTAKKLNH
ncbi:hypothetical protein E4T56_gene16847 [Termitomyces sp. T112]|nr:hypothetical protein E4T56_gene16847 [Termitomyces sp. T112]